MQRPLGFGELGVVLNEAVFPSKQTESFEDDVPNPLQKSLFDCQKSIIFDDEPVIVLLCCKDGANGELSIDVLLQVSQTSPQKSFSEFVGLHKTGTV